MSLKSVCIRAAGLAGLTASLMVGGSDVLRAQDSTRLLARVFTDHAVVQRGTPVAVWGVTSPGSLVTVTLGASSAEARADDGGHWEAELPAREAGGPLVLVARSSEGKEQAVEDVMVGDVFLCSGQSNMVLPVSRTRFGAFEGMRATDSRIRMLTVPDVSDPAPGEELPEGVTWEVASPESVPGWSGTCYYFARELRSGPLEDVPVGLITAAWGGSSIRPWMDAAALRTAGGYDEALDVLQLYLEDERAAQEAFGRIWQAWWLEQPGTGSADSPWQPDSGVEWPAAPDGLGDWNAWDGLQGFTGMVWFRTTLDLTADEASGGATLMLGAVDEVDQTWINGRVVGNTFGYGTERVYPIQAGLLREGHNVLVVNVLNTYASGGMTGDHGLRALILADGTRYPLSEWQYLPVRSVRAEPPRAPWEAVGGLSTIHNGMVAPLRHYGLSGVVWYQGESDTGRGAEYPALLGALIRQWRRQFGRPDAVLPAFVVQLPNYGPWPTGPGESGWAEVRDAQRVVTAADPSAGLVVTIDVGDPRDLHPANKQAVGERLARAARSILYGEADVLSGPAPVSAKREGRDVVVTFGDVSGDLVTYGGASPPGFEVCGDRPDSCHYADARAAGSQVRVLVEGDDPITRIRYAWADSPIVTLFDESGLPVGPFEIPIDSDRRP